MGLPVSVEKVEETSDHCVYTFGSPDTTAGRVRLHKSSGDVELIALSERDGASSEKYYLAHLVPRLQGYHDQGTYPATDHWET